MNVMHEISGRRDEYRALRKSELFSRTLDWLAANRHLVVWFEPMRDRSLIIGQLSTGTALAVVVKLPQQPVPESISTFLATVNAHNGVGIVARDPEAIERWIRGLGL